MVIADKCRLPSQWGERIRPPRHPLSPDQDDRNAVQSWLGSQSEPWAVDLFSGAGGLSLGLEEAGFSVVAASLKLAGLLDTFLRELPHRQREVFDLIELQGMPAKEVARLMGIRAASVRGSLFEARRTLRRRILAVWPDVREDLP